MEREVKGDRESEWRLRDEEGGESEVSRERGQGAWKLGRERAGEGRDRAADRAGMCKDRT